MTLAPDVALPDAVAFACTVLSDADLPPAGPKVPNPRPTEFYVVRRLGGPAATPVSDGPLITIEAWGPSGEAAHDLLQQARTAIHTARGTSAAGAFLYRVDEASGPADLPDPTSDQSRYVMQLQLHLRAT